MWEDSVAHPTTMGWPFSTSLMDWYRLVPKARINLFFHLFLWVIGNSNKKRKQHRPALSHLKPKCLLVLGKQHCLHLSCLPSQGGQGQGTLLSSIKLASTPPPPAEGICWWRKVRLCRFWVFQGILGRTPSSALRLGTRFNLYSSRNDGLQQLQVLLNGPLRLQSISKLESLFNPPNLDQGLYTYIKGQRLGPEQKPLHRPSPKVFLES